MIRTTLSFCALFGSLLLVSKWLYEARPTASPERPAATPADSASEPAPLPADSRPATPIQPASSDQEQPAIQLAAFDDDDSLADVLNSLRPEKTEQAADTRGGSASQGNADAGTATGERSLAEAQEDAAKQEDSAAASKENKDKEFEIEITPELAELRGRLRECLSYYYFRPENVALRSPWGAMHAMIAYGVDTELIAGDRRVNAIGYLCYNGVCNGQQLFYIAGDKLQTRIGPGVQGHPGQFLAMLAQSRVKTDFPIRVDGRELTVADLIQHEKETCRPKSELTFKLISFTHYLKSDEKWKSNDGQDWDIPRVIKEELAQPIVGAACGGTHRMTGFSYAVRKREQRGEKFEGQWLRAKKFVADYHEYAFKLQNPDGSFSTDWFAGRADFGPASKRLETTGHITEWLAYSLNKEQLVEPRMTKSVSYLTNLLLEGREEKWGIGPLGHGLHALALYDERVFGGKPGQRATELAAVRKAKAKTLER